MRSLKWILFTIAWISLALFSLYEEGKSPQKIYWRTLINKELPGPQDAWAGHGPHLIIIKKPLPQEELVLWIHTQDTHNQFPPQLKIYLDRIFLGNIQLKPGMGNPSHKEGLPRSYSIPLKVIPGTFKDQHEILIQNNQGSWVRVESIELTSIKKAFHFAELYKPNLSSLQVFFFWLLAVGLCWSLFWFNKSFWFYGLITFGYTSALVFLNLYPHIVSNLWGFRALLPYPKGIKILGAYLLIGFFILPFPSRLHLSSWQKWGAWGTLLIIFWLLRSFNDPPDGAQWIRFAPEGIFSPREPMATYLQHLAYLGFKSFLPNPRDALSFFSIILGGASIYLLWKWGDNLFEKIEPRVFFVLSFLSTFGFTALFLGHTETYPILITALMGYLWATADFFKKKTPPYWSTLLFSTALTIHLATIWLLPAQVYLLTQWIRRHETLSTRGILKFIGITLLPFFLTIGLMLYYRVEIGGWINDFLHAFPKSSSPFLSPKEILSLTHLKDYLSEHFFLAPSLLLLLGFTLLKGRNHILMDPLNTFLFLAVFSFEFYTFTFRPGLGAQRDWDLFSPLVPFGLGFALYNLRKMNRFSVLIIPIIGISLFQTIPLVWTNHKSTNFVLVKEHQKPDINIPQDWILLDTLDVGNPQDESKHNYQIKKEARSPIPRFGTVPEREIKCAGDQAFLWDNGRAHQGTETFLVKAQVGAPLFIVKRIHGDIANQAVNVLVNGKDAGRWEIPGRAKNSFRSSLFIIPSSFIQSPEIRLTFESLSPDLLVTSYYYWIYTPQKIPSPG